MALAEDLVALDNKGNIHYYPVIEVPEVKNWEFGVGNLTIDILSDYMPIPSVNSAVAVCAHPELQNETIGNLKTLGFSDENIIMFV